MWSAYLFQVSTGQIGARLNFADLSWEIDLNESETIKLTLSKMDLPKVDLSIWLEPLWAGVVLFWNDVPFVAGPILSRSNETDKSVTLDCRGIRSILSRRLVIKELSDWSGLSRSTLTFEDMSLGTIMKEAVKQAQRKPGGSLPISYPVFDEVVYDSSLIPEGLPACTVEDGSSGPNPCFWDASIQGNGTGRSYAIIGKDRIYVDEDNTRTRTYRGFNLQNINADQILKKLSEVSNGPDIMFRPRLIDDNQLTFDMWHGTEQNPRISQREMHVWDTTAERSEVSDMSIIVTGVYQTHRVFSIGAGQDEGTLISVSSDLSRLNLGFPLIESAIQTSQSEDIRVVGAHGDANLAANSKSLREIQMTVHGDGIHPFGKFWPGDVCEVIVKGWLALPDGKHRMRILNMTGGSSSFARMSLQLDA